MPDQMLPTDDDNEKEDPFEDFINRDLGMESVLKSESPATPDDDDDFLASIYRHRDMHDDDEEDDDADSSRTAPRFGGFPSRLNPSSTGSESPFRPFGSRPSAFNSSSGSSSLFGRSGPPLRSSPLSGGGLLKPFMPTPPAPPATFWQRLRLQLRQAIGEEIMFFILMFAGLLAMASTLLYIDNLRLSIALRDGQIQELRAQLIDFQRQMTPGVELTPLASE